tara:strand:+ start:290 stop:613 length:324 start_codon:yes stop_codon:yes gene_type:complete
VSGDSPSTLGSGLKILANQLLLKRRQRLEWNPVDAIHRARVDGFLDAVSRIAILANRSGTTEIGLHHERVGGHMGAVTTTDAGGFIHPHGFLSQGTTQNRLTAGSFD